MVFNKPNSFQKLFTNDLSIQPLSDAQLAARLDWCRAYEDYLWSVQVNLTQLPLARKALGGSSIQVAAPVNFPLAGLPPELAWSEAQQALHLGAQQLEVCLSPGRLLGAELEAVQREVETLCSLAKSRDCAVELVVSFSLLDDPRKRWCARLAASLGASLRTAAGTDQPASPDDLRMLRFTPGATLFLTACAVAPTLAECQEYLEAGAIHVALANFPDLLAELEAQP